MERIFARGAIPFTALLLGVAGLIPFLLAALSQWVELRSIPQEFGYRAGVIYAAIILSFLGGIRWGAALARPESERQSIEFVGSNVAALAGWLALLLPPVPCVSLLIAGFLLQGLWDLMASEDGALPLWFGRLRSWLTAVVVVCLAAVLLRAAIS